MVGKKPTVSDVARVAQVSKATVSRALRGFGSVDPELAARVKEAADRLGYTPNPVAQDLRFGSSQSVGVLVPDLANPYFSRLVQEISRAAAAQGFRTLLSDTDGDAEAELDALRELARHVDGIVMCSPRMSDQDLAAAANMRNPLVMTARVSPGLGITTITVDSYTDCSELIGKLHQMGHRKIAYVAGPERSWQNGERRRAVTDAARFGMESVIIAGGSEIVDGYQAVEPALAAKPTAIVAFNDILAIGIYEGLRERGLSIPDEMSVASFDDISFASHLAPALTTVASDRAEMGRQAFLAVAARMNDDEVEVHQSVASSILLRGSVGPVPVTA